MGDRGVEGPWKTDGSALQNQRLFHAIGRPPCCLSPAKLHRVVASRGHPYDGSPFAPAARLSRIGAVISMKFCNAE
jgi:hypothetical protein